MAATHVSSTSTGPSGPVPVPITERRLHLAGIPTKVQVGGSGPEMVLVSGPGERTSHWSRVLPELATTHQVVSPDLPLWAFRDLDTFRDMETSEPAANRALAWLGELIDRTCGNPPVLVGAGRGGSLAARFAATCPAGRLEQLVLVDSLGPTPFQPAPDFWAALYQFLRTCDHAATKGRQHVPAELDGLGERLDAQWAAIQPDDSDCAWRQRAMTALGVVIDKLGGPPVAPDELAGIPVPTTLIWGRHDRTTPLAVAQAASTRYGWPLHVIDGCGDDPPLEVPHAFVKILRSAVRGASVVS